MNARRRTTALLEVMGVYLVGPLVARHLVRVLGFRLVNPFDNFTADITDSQLIIATRQMLALLAAQYVGYFLVIIPINWWHRRSGPAAYGFTKAGLSWRTLLLAGVATVASTRSSRFASMVAYSATRITRSRARSTTPRPTAGRSAKACASAWLPSMA